MPKVLTSMTKARAQEKMRYLMRQSRALESRYGKSDFQHGKQVAYDECLEIIKNIKD